MNNRILARIVAAVMAIAMLGTVSFAASISGDVINVGAPSDSEYTEQAQKTAVAYFAATADAEPAADDIIAIYQASGVPGEIKIDTAKATALEGSDRKYLVVKCGGSGGADTAQTFAIDLTTTEAPATSASTYTIDYGTWEKVFSNVAAFTQTITLGADQTVESYGFKLWKDGGTNTSEDKPLYFTEEANLSGQDGAEFSFGIVMVAVPDDVTLTAKSFYTIK